jgi:hypothetical protein
VIRDLKAAIGCGGDEHTALKQIAELVGSHQAGETAHAIRASLAEKPAPRGGGRR